MGFCLQGLQQVYLPGRNYLFIKQQNNKQTILSHIIIIISRYNKINKINSILINKINHHKIKCSWIKILNNDYYLSIFVTIFYVANIYTVALVFFLEYAQIVHLVLAQK